MRFFYVIIAALISTGPLLAHEVRLYFPLEQLSISDEGMVLITEDFGSITLSNIQCDKGGYYSVCEGAFSCFHCGKELEGLLETCDCGSTEICASQQGEFTGSPYTVAQWVAQIFRDPANWEILLAKIKWEVGENGGLVEVKAKPVPNDKPQPTNKPKPKPKPPPSDVVIKVGPGHLEVGVKKPF